MSRRDREHDWNGAGRGLTLILQTGVSMLAPVFLCMALGIWLDSLLGTKYISLICLVLGILAGGRNTWILAKGYLETEKRREEHREESFDLLGDWDVPGNENRKDRQE